MIQSEEMPHPPCHIVIGAGAVAAYSEPARGPIAVVERQPAPEYDDAAERLADQRILRATILRGLAGIQSRRVGRAAQRGAEQITAGLRLRIQIGRRHRLVAETESICGVCLF